MRPNSFTTYAIAVAITIFVSTVIAEDNLLSLENDPFSRPDVLKKKSPRTRINSQVSPPSEEIELELTATMVSENAPMVIVNGEMLAIGEKIGKMKLIAVMEGEAIFSRGGRKYSFMIDTLKLK